LNLLSTVGVMVSALYQILLSPITRKIQHWVWGGFSLVFPLWYGILALQRSFASVNVVQDDVRQHVFWMLRFLDADLFPRDMLADYFQSVAPLGYQAIYYGAAMLGINPLALSKVLPLVLGLLTSYLFWRLCLSIFPVPAFAVSATILLNQTLWNGQDLISATPRAFACPILLLFLYALERGSRFYPLPKARGRYGLNRWWLLGLGAIALQALFYPQFVLLCAGLLLVRLGRWHDGRLTLSQNQQDFFWCSTGLLVAGLCLLPYALDASPFAPLTTVAEAKQMPEFWPGGRNAFFHPSPLLFWLGGRSGIVPSSGLTPATLGAAFLLPLLWVARGHFPLAQRLLPRLGLVLQLAIAALGLFGLAHLLLFRLHLPSRYTGYPMRLSLALLAGAALAILVERLLRWGMAANRRWQRWVAMALFAGLVVVLLAYSLTLKNFPHTQYAVGRQPELYAFLQQQPKDSLIATLAQEADNLPTFSQRSVLVSRELALPYHQGYYRQIRQRLVDLITAQYTPDGATLRQFIRRYGIDFWLLEDDALAPNYLAQNPWLQHYQPATQLATAILEQGAVPALFAQRDRCTVWQHSGVQLLSAECVAQALEK
jgi:hypothetical protein